ncbi:MAG: SCP2 sterol-binding domain-containing protein [Pseudomonadota bacterium]
MTLAVITTKIQQKLAPPVTLRAKVLFDFGADGVLYIDTTQSPPVLTHNSDGVTPELTLQCTLATFAAILAGVKDPNIAYMTGQLKIKGPLSLAMRLNAFLED